MCMAHRALPEYDDTQSNSVAFGHKMLGFSITIGPCFVNVIENELNSV
uniref:Uncharacterized protein n=1 Tax=Arundo donax TaxID=35708 RepID=A0A0A9BUD2_ARUDO